MAMLRVCLAGAKHWRLLFALTCLLLAACPATSQEAFPWMVVGRDGQPRVQLYFFWSQRCPHCLQALPFVDVLAQMPGIQVHSHELTGSRANVALYIDMAASLGQEARSVPAFFVCGRLLVGFDSAEGMGRQILELVDSCHAQATAQMAEGSSGAVAIQPVPADGETAPVIAVPVLGELDVRDYSLPMFTLVIAGLDAFNPCAFFVLLFLLSLMVHAGSRARMLLIGGTFVFFSGFLYFLFMAAWLNLFLLLGSAPVVTSVAGVVAVIIGLLNLKDYLAFGQGPSLSIPEGAKPRLFQRMRGLLAADRKAAMLLATVTLALAANSYELLCTAGFPMVYTRVLTLAALAPPQYYGYLAFYNLIYVLPLLAIVAVFTITLGRKKLTERQGRLLKLLSGLMMLGLGLVMLMSPELLGQLWVGVALLAVAVLVTAASALVGRWRKQARVR